jgi:hypothetical protein
MRKKDPFHKDGHYTLGGIECNEEGCERWFLSACIPHENPVLTKTFCKEHAHPYLSIASVRVCTECGQATTLWSQITWHPYPIQEEVEDYGKITEFDRLVQSILSDPSSTEAEEKQQFVTMENAQGETIWVKQGELWCESCAYALLDAAKRGEVTINEDAEVFVEVEKERKKEVYGE